jgi:hypothetical protein
MVGRKGQGADEWTASFREPLFDNGRSLASSPLLLCPPEFCKEELIQGNEHLCSDILIVNENIAKKECSSEARKFACFTCFPAHNLFFCPLPENLPLAGNRAE